MIVSGSNALHINANARPDVKRTSAQMPSVHSSSSTDDVQDELLSMAMTGYQRINVLRPSTELILVIVLRCPVDKS